MRLWGYFVASSQNLRETVVTPMGVGDARVLKLLWVGRMVPLKHVDTIIRAVRCLIKSGIKNISLTLVGDGPERGRLETLAKELPVTFKPFMPVEEVRNVMRMHHAYVFASDATDGWGAVVNEALAEGVLVVSSREPGSGVTILPDSCLYDCGSVSQLCKLLKGIADGSVRLPVREIADRWSAEKAARGLVAFAREK